MLFIIAGLLFLILLAIVGGNPVRQMIVGAVVVVVGFGLLLLCIGALAT